MRGRWWRAVVALVALGALALPTVAATADDGDGQAVDVASRYAATPTGWMTSQPSDRVHDFAQIGDTVYVAGTFTGIQPTRNGPVTPQGYLAAFDADTGVPRSGFAPVFNGTVHDLEVAPDGSRLYASGAFTVVNNVARNRVVALDPGTGATITSFTPNVGGGSVYTSVLSGTTLYLGGNFSAVNGQARTRLAAISATTGAPLAWAPTAEGNVVLTLEPSPDGTRLYAGGRFSSVNGQPDTAYLTALDAQTGQVQTAFRAQPGREVFDLLADDQGVVWSAQGGSLGRFDLYRASDGSLITRHESEGDGESVERIGRLVYVGGHDIGPSGVERSGIIDPAAPAILDAAAWPEPTTGGDGTWAFHSTGSDLWQGGNFDGPFYGFARYPAVDEPPARTELVPTLSTWRYRDGGSAPAAGWNQPGFDAAAWASGGAELGFGDGGEITPLTPGSVTYWFRRTFTVTGAATATDVRLDLLDDDGAVVYVNGTEVARDNLPTGTIAATTRATTAKGNNGEDTFVPFAVPAGLLHDGENTIAVEVHQNAINSSDLSFDARLSAVIPDPEAVPVELVARGATWRYRDDGSDQGTAWRQRGFDDSGWSSGSAELGREDGDEATVLAGGHVTDWFRRRFDVTGASTFQDLHLGLVADDGAVVYLNGTEVVRDNLPAGTVTATTPATDYRWRTDDEAALRSFSVDPALLVEGTNVLAVELHQAPGSPDASFDLRLAGTAGGPADTTPPSVPTDLASPAQTDTTADLAWSASTDDRRVDHYDVFVDGSPAASPAGPSTTITGLAPASTHQVEVEAVDPAGNRSGRSAPLSVTTTGAAGPPVDVVRFGATWRYRDVGATPPASWSGLGFDDSAWVSGPAVLGREDGDEATVLASGAGTRWFRRTFAVPSASAVTALSLDLVADDGAVVYLNGSEVVRDNLPAGALDASTPATDYRWRPADEANPRTFTVPGASLVDGVNVLAVELHQASGSTDARFDARLVATGVPADAGPPTVPTGLTSTGQTSSSVTLAWTASTDDGVVDHYDVFVDGAGPRSGTTAGTAFTVSGLSAGSHTFEVEAVDAAGRRSGRSAPLTASAGSSTVELVARGATWRYQTTAPAPAWSQPGFDDSAWPQGAAELGREDGDEATVVGSGTATTWFRRSFDASPAGLTSMVLELLADDGAVVYLNGTEVVRDNLPAGPLSATTPATDYRWSAADETAMRPFTVAPSLLVSGTNVLAVELHQAQGSTDASFDLRLSAA